MALFDTIPGLLRAQSARQPGRFALRALDRPGMTFRELDELTWKTAAALMGLGVGKGDRIGIVLPNGPDMASAFLSVARVATAAPMNPGLKEAEFAFYLEDLGARAVYLAEEDATECSAAAEGLGIPIVRPQPSPALPPPPEPGPSDIALVLHTSGTTAKPKIVPLSHFNLCRSAANVAQTLNLAPEDTCLNVMPLFHIHGLVAALLASLSSGGSVVCTPGFMAPDFFDWMAQMAPTWYTAVPTMHQAILGRAGEAERETVRKNGLRLIRSSSASMPPSVLLELEEAFGVPVIEAYGMTEAAHQMASNPLPPGARKPGSVGLAAGPEVAVADERGGFLSPGHVGEVVIRGPNVFLRPGLVSNRGSGISGRGRIPVPHRPVEGDHQPRRRDHRAEGDRRGSPGTPFRDTGRGLFCARPGVGRGSGRGRGPGGWGC